MQWTPDLADTWAQAYGLAVKVMVAATEEREDIAPPPIGRRVHIAPWEV